MKKIKVQDLKEDQTISEEEIKHVKGGALRKVVSGESSGTSWDDTKPTQLIDRATAKR